MSKLVHEEGGSDGSWISLQDQLHAYFGSTSQHRCLLWVDPAQADPFDGNDLVEQLRVRVPIRHPRFDLNRAPYLVPLDLSRSDHAVLFNDSVELAWRSWSTEYLTAMQGRPICGWVRTQAEAKAVARHWGANCHLHFYRRQSRLLRFQDPGVREWLWPSLDQTQQQAMLGPASEIVSINRSQELIPHRRPDAPRFSSTHAENASNAFPALRISESHWDGIDDYAALHAAWLKWRSSATDEAVVSQAAGWARPVLRALAHASHLGIRDGVDRELFALHALRLGTAFYQHPKLDDVWPKTRAGEFYGSAVEQVIGCPPDQLVL